MTYEQVKQKLENVRKLKRLCLRIQKEINNYRDTYDALACPLGNHAPGGGAISDPTQRLALRVIAKREEFEEALTLMMDEEDELTAAVALLPPTERDIIIGYYIQDRTHYQLARECSYSEQHIRRLKVKAIKKIGDKI